MPHPKGGYRLQDGTRIPGVTTVIGRWKEAGGLMYWSWDQGRNGFDFRETRDSAAEAGTIAHALVEYHITGKSDQEIAQMLEEQRVSKDVLEKANQAFNNYLNWEKQTKLKVVETEMSLVSEKYKYGGTYDGVAVVEIEGERSLADWKTGGIYVEALIQCAAYKNLWEEHNPTKLITGGVHIVSFSREAGDFAHRYFSDLSDAWRQFILLREAYDIDKKLKKRLA